MIWEAVVNSRPCRQCGFARAPRVRESVTCHGSHRYTMRWYLCPECQDVSFTYRVEVAPLVATPAASLAPSSEEAEASAVVP
jgi:hypothetical protein